MILGSLEMILGAWNDSEKKSQPFDDSVDRLSVRLSAQKTHR